MKHYKGLLYCVLFTWILLASLQNGYGGNKLKAENALSIQAAIGQRGGTGCVRHYMAINHGYRSTSFNANQAGLDLWTIAQDSGAVLISHMESSALAMATIAFEVAEAISSMVAHSLLLLADLIRAEAIALHLPEYVDHMTPVMTKAGFGGIHHADMMPALLSSFDLLISQFCQFADTLVSQGLVKFPLDAASVMGLMTGFLFAMVAYQLGAASARRAVPAKCSACKERKLQQDQAKSLDVQGSGDGMAPMPLSVCEVQVKVAGRKLRSLLETQKAFKWTVDDMGLKVGDLKNVNREAEAQILLKLDGQQTILDLTHTSPLSPPHD